jgi:hypothetical protein
MFLRHPTCRNRRSHCSILQYLISDLFYGAPDSCDAPQSRFDPMTLFLNRQSFMKRGRLRWEDTAAALTSIGRSLRLHCSILQSRLSKVPVASWVFRIRADERYCLANEAGIRESTKIYHCGSPASAIKCPYRSCNTYHSSRL